MDIVKIVQIKFKMCIDIGNPRYWKSRRIIFLKSVLTIFHNSSKLYYLKPENHYTSFSEYKFQVDGLSNLTWTENRLYCVRCRLAQQFRERERERARYHLEKGKHCVEKDKY